MLALALLAAAIALVAGCGTKRIGRSVLSTTLGTRTVKASVDGGASISSRGDSAIVSFSGGKLVVEKGRVLLDDKELAKVPEEAKTVEIDCTGGKLTVTADGATLASADVKK
jgi:hypothetical protein